MENQPNIASNDSNLKLNMNSLDAPGFVDELEGIINNEPVKNKYETVKLNKLNIFPYYLIGKVVSKFDFDGVSKYLNGVGILIGPDVLLTVAHNLCHLSLNSNGSKKILITKKVCFFAAANGDFNLFEPVKSEKIYIPPNYITSLKTDNREEQLYNDWGLVFLSSQIGDKIVNILDVEKTNNIRIDNKLYQFFINNQNLNLSNLSKQTKSDKISIVGYTEYKDNYRNNAAYKFLSNFTATENNINNLNNLNLNANLNKSQDKIAIKCPTNFNSDFSKVIKQNFNFANQGKIISEIVNDKELFQMTNDKKIKINININTDTEGLLSTPNRYNFNQYQKTNSNSNIENTNSAAGLEYIILGNEELNKEFDQNDTDKLIMSESKGNFIGFQMDANNNNINNNEENNSDFFKAIKYQISTYKGQSGSPIFMRIKKISDKKNQDKKANKNSYFYHFIGLHSRRGPITGEQKFYESEKMNALTENIMTSEIKSIIKISHDTKFKNVTNNSNNKTGYDKSNSDLYKICLQNEIVKQNGMCEYNIALSIIGDSIKEIKDVIEKQIEEDKKNCNQQNSISEYANLYADNSNNNSSDTNLSNNHIKSDFVLTKIYLNNAVQLTGLFKKSVQLSVLFSFGAKIFNVPKEYILLKDMNNNEFSTIHNYNFDSNKKYFEVMQNIDNTVKMSFELMLNIKKYGAFMSNNILQKFLENYDLEESQLKKEFEKKYMKPLFHSIFAEITTFENNYTTYGKLFKKIRKTILIKLGLFDNKN